MNVEFHAFDFQHCKAAVDEETFQKMVDRQYELLRRPRTIDEVNANKNLIRAENNELTPSIGPAAPINAAINVSATVNATEPEVIHE